jgi:hypothetical protein
MVFPPSPAVWAAAGERVRGRLYGGLQARGKATTGGLSLPMRRIEAIEVISNLLVFPSVFVNCSDRLDEHDNEREHYRQSDPGNYQGQDHLGIPGMMCTRRLLRIADRKGIRPPWREAASLCRKAH